MRVLHTIPIILLMTLTGCLGNRGSQEPEAVRTFEREIDASLDGIEYRLQRLRSTETAPDEAERTFEELRLHRHELRMQLDSLIAEPDSVFDATHERLRSRLEDLAIRYETARLGRFETRALFEEAVEARFDDLDRELAVLEGQVLQAELRERFDASIARLYRLRNDVALRIAEAEAASDKSFPRFKSELASAIGRLDIMLAHTTLEVDRAFEKKHPLRSLNELWL